MPRGSGRRPTPPDFSRLTIVPVPQTGDGPTPGGEMLPSPPTWMDDVAKEEWHRLVDAMVDRGMLNLFDHAIFVSYCVMYAQMVRTSIGLGMEGAVYYDQAGNPKKHPYASLQMEAIRILSKLGAEFGMTPRTRVSAGLVPKQAEQNKLQRYVRRRGLVDPEE